MYENSASYRAKQQNLLRSKTQSFLQKYSESTQRIKSRSSMHKLMGKIYSKKNNAQFSPNKSASRLSMHSKLSIDNPELNHSHLVKGLNLRASQISNYSDINTELLFQRKKMEQKILFIKNELAKQEKIYGRLDLNCKRISNQVERSSNRIKELTIKSQRFMNGIEEAFSNCEELRNQLTTINKKNADAMKSINEQMCKCNSLDDKSLILKKNLLIQEKNAKNLRNQLIKKQKVMNSVSILTKELQNQRAVLLLQINKSVSQIVFKE